MTIARWLRAAAQDVCEPPCPLGMACVDGMSEKVSVDDACPTGCPPGFVCSGGTCVEDGSGKCAPCERFDPDKGCLPLCRPGEGCVGGECVLLVEDEARCQPPCPAGFVCADGRCVEGVSGECGPCEFYDAVDGCHFACAEPELCIHVPKWEGWHCSSDLTPPPCFVCEGRHCRDQCGVGKSASPARARRARPARASRPAV
jgi:hypothetical protein